MKTYDLNVQTVTEFEGTGEAMGYFTRGHFDAEKFIDELVTGWEPEKTPQASEITHEFWRLVPAGTGLKGMVIKAAKAGQKGAFPVTYWDCG